MNPVILIITGFGVNCEAESSHAWRLAGAEVLPIHLNDLFQEPTTLQRAQGLMFIGGFSYGDHLTSGHVLAQRVKHRLQDELRQFIEAGKIILGVCNGFQTMVKIGLLPGLDNDFFTQRVALMPNDCGVFQNYWIDLQFDPQSPCIFTQGLSSMPLPIRHGEGKLHVGDAPLLARIESAHLAPCRYLDTFTGLPAKKFPSNPNGSVNAIAGLCDPTGRIFGLMPHPEAFLFPENHPQWDFIRLRQELPEHGDGLKIFQNAVRYLRQS